jgi:hypothetical protein
MLLLSRIAPRYDVFNHRRIYRAGHHRQALTLPRPLEKGFLKVLGFIIMLRFRAYKQTLLR